MINSNLEQDNKFKHKNVTEIAFIMRIAGWQNVIASAKFNENYSELINSLEGLYDEIVAFLMNRKGKTLKEIFVTDQTSTLDMMFQQAQEANSQLNNSIIYLSDEETIPAEVNELKTLVRSKCRIIHHYLNLLILEKNLLLRRSSDAGLAMLDQDGGIEDQDDN